MWNSKREVQATGQVETGRVICGDLGEIQIERESGLQTRQLHQLVLGLCLGCVSVVSVDGKDDFGSQENE